MPWTHHDTRQLARKAEAEHRTRKLREAFMSKTITIPGFIYASPADSWDAGPHVLDGHKLSFIHHKDLGAPYIKLVPYTLTFELPEGWDPRAQRIDALREEEKKLRAEFHVRVTQIQAQISKLQALEMSA